MNVVKHRLYRDEIRLSVPFVTALRRVDAVSFIVLELIDDTGRIGRGSAPASEAVTGETLESIETALEQSIVPAIMQGRDLYTAISANSSAKAAADMALYDLSNSAFRLDCEVKTAVTVSLDAPEAMAEAAKRLFLRGCEILKVKVGSDDGLDVKRIQMIRQALPEATLLVDANQAWRVDEAIDMIEKMAFFDVVLIEQPVDGSDIEGLKCVKTQSSVPILADEAVFTLDDAKRVIEYEAADMINIKLMKCGGISPAEEILELCQSHHLPVMLGSMLEGPVSIRAATCLAARWLDVIQWIDLDSPLLYHPDVHIRDISLLGNHMTIKG